MGRNNQTIIAQLHITSYYSALSNESCSELHLSLPSLRVREVTAALFDFIDVPVSMARIFLYRAAVTPEVDSVF